MFRRVMIGLAILSGIAFLWTDAYAGCTTIAGRQLCASWITGGSEIGIVTAEGYAPNNGACPGVVAVQGVCDPYDCECNRTCGPDFTVGTPNVQAAGFTTQQDPPPSPPVFVSAVTLRLVGTVPTVDTPQGTRCGLGATDDATCDIRGVVFCGDATSDPKHGPDHPGKHLGHLGSARRNATTDGPLAVLAPGFAQVDPFAGDGEGRHFAGFRFQINAAEQNRLCPDEPFRTFVAQEGFFEACVVPAANPFCDPSPSDPSLECTCVREFCTVSPPASPDEVRQYQCRPVTLLGS